jgi:molybdopterin-guanine dinucleotide biosynthesis protein A
MFEGVQPIVLVGGQSKRFGRDKLREPLRGGRPGEVLVDRPIAALRAVFGSRVACVGECHSDVSSRADLAIPDRYPGVGPIGGILSALEETGGEVFVLAGDLARITAGVVRQILDRARDEHEEWAVLARTTRIEPCIGLYRPAAAVALRARLTSGRDASLFDAIAAERLITVPVDAGVAANVNTPADLAVGRGGPGAR